MKKALGAIPKIPRWPKFPKIPDAPNAPSAGSPGSPGMAAAAPGGTAPRAVPGDVHTLPGRIIKRIAAAIGRRSNMKVGSDEHIRRVMAEFPLDRYRDADGKVRCPLSQEQRNRLKSAFED
jgi:hypothetical protein